MDNLRSRRSGRVQARRGKWHSMSGRQRTGAQSDPRMIHMRASRVYACTLRVSDGAGVKQEWSARGYLQVGRDGAMGRWAA